MGRDLHAYLEYYDKESMIWEGLACFYFKRYQKFFDILIENANGMPKDSDTTLTFASPKLLSNEIWAAWRADRERLGIHHEGHLNYTQLCEVFMAFILGKEYPPTELRSLLDAAEVYDLREYEVRFVYWFDN